MERHFLRMQRVCRKGSWEFIPQPLQALGKDFWVIGTYTDPGGLSVPISAPSSGPSQVVCPALWGPSLTNGEMPFMLPETLWTFSLRRYSVELPP